MYVALEFIKSDACVGTLKRYLWKPVEFNAYNELSTAALSHVLSLSYEFHSSKDTNEIFMAVFKGKNIIELVDTLCFKMVPMFIDLILVFWYLYYLFGPYMAIILTVTIFTYLYTTSKFNAIAKGRRRKWWADYTREWGAQRSTIGNWLLAKVSTRLYAL